MLCIVGGEGTCLVALPPSAKKQAKMVKTLLKFSKLMVIKFCF